MKPIPNLKSKFFRNSGWIRGECFAWGGWWIRSWAAYFWYRARNGRYFKHGAPLKMKNQQKKNIQKILVSSRDSFLYCVHWHLQFYSCLECPQILQILIIWKSRMDPEKPSQLAEKIQAAKERREKLQKERDAARSGLWN